MTLPNFIEFKFKNNNNNNNKIQVNEITKALALSYIDTQ